MIFGCNVGDTLYVALKDKQKVCDFKVNCLKVFESDYTAHGYVYSSYSKWGEPKEFSLKYLNKRVIFTEKKNAEKWLKSQQ